MFKHTRKGDTPLYLKASALNENHVIAEALNQIPNLSREMRAIGWKLAIEELPGDSDFYQDMLGWAIAPNPEIARSMLLAFVDLLDRNAETVMMSDCILQAYLFTEEMNKRVRNLTIHWSRERATNPKVVPLFPARRLSVTPIGT